MKKKKKKGKKKVCRSRERKRSEAASASRTTPMLDTAWSEKTASVYRNSMLLLPTPLSPINSTLNVCSHRTLADAGFSESIKDTNEVAMLSSVFVSQIKDL
jgi:hypothetical protein